MASHALSKRLVLAVAMLLLGATPAVAAAAITEPYETEAVIQLEGVSPSGAALISGGRELLVAEHQSGQVSFSIREVATGKELRRLRPRTSAWVFDLAAVWDVSADGTRLALGVVESNQRYLLVLDIATDEEVKRFLIPTDGVLRGVAISSDAGYVASISGTILTQLRVWNADSGEQVQEISTGSSTSFEFSADGTRVVTFASVATGLFSGGVDAWADVWDVASGRSLAQVRVKDAGFNRAVFSPNGRHFLTANRGGAKSPTQPDSAATLWDASTGKEVMAIGRGEGPTTKVAFSAAGARIAAVSMDRRVRVWDAATGDLIAVLAAPDSPAGPVRVEVAPGSFIELPEAEWSGVSAVFAPEGTSLVTTSLDGSVKVWVDAGEKQVADKAALTENLAAAQGGDAEAMHRLASTYRDGRGVERNGALATQWLTQAADGGHGPANLELASALLTGDGGNQDCVVGGDRLRKAVALGSVEAGATLDAVLSPLGGRQGAAAMTPQIQADLLEAQIIDVLTRQEYPAFLANLCALEALGHADRLPVEARRELLYHRALALRAGGKPQAALAALNQYLNEAGNAGANYTQAIQLLRPLQDEAKNLREVIE